MGLRAAPPEGRVPSPVAPHLGRRDGFRSWGSGDRDWQDAAEAFGPPGAAEPTSSTRGTVREKRVCTGASAAAGGKRGVDDGPDGGVAGRRWSSPGSAPPATSAPRAGVPVSGRRGRQSGRRAPIGRGRPSGRSGAGLGRLPVGRGGVASTKTLSRFLLRPRWPGRRPWTAGGEEPSSSELDYLQQPGGWHERGSSGESLKNCAP